MAVACVYPGYLERVAMRNALGLMLASVVTAVLITGVWFWTSSPRADAAPPQTVAARKAEPCRPAAAKPAPKDDVEITASLSKPAPRPPVPAAQPARSACANPDALGVSRIVVIDTTGGPGFGFLQYKQFDFLDRQGSRAHLRRRSVADHARRAEGAGG